MSDETAEMSLQESCRDAVRHLSVEVHLLAAKADRLEQENVKLRELVRNVEHYERVGCHECPYEDSCDAGTLYDEECAMSREIEREKGELGMDV